MNLPNYVKYSVILSILPAIYYSLLPGKIVAATILCAYPLIFLLPTQIESIKRTRIDGKYITAAFCVLNLVVLLGGTVNAAEPRDWSALLSNGVAVAVLLPSAIYIGADSRAFVAAARSFLNFGLPLVAVLFFTTQDPGPLGFARQIAPLYLLIVVSPFLNRKFLLLITVLSVLTLTSYAAIRSNVINITFAAATALTYFGRRATWMAYCLQSLRVALLTLPLLFCTLGYFGIANIFSISDLYKGITVEDSRGFTRDVFVDSRTPIYTDVITELEKKGAVLYGLGGYGKTETSLTTVANADYDKIYIGGRSATESGMLNYFQWCGIIGATVYYLLFARASYLAMHKSNNWLCMMLGLFTAFKALYSFIEDPLIFAPGPFFELMMIGMCLSKKLRLMNDQEVTQLLRTGFVGARTRLQFVSHWLK